MLNAVSWNSGSNGQLTLKVKVQDPHFQYQLRESQNAYLVILAQIHYKLSLGQAKFPRFYMKVAKMTLKVKVNNPHFQYQLRIQDACFVLIWWFKPKSMKSYHAGKPNFLEFQVTMAKMTLKIRSMTPIFNTSWEYLMMHVWCKFGDFSWNLWRVIVWTR